jgi:hypothetical protein
VLSQHTSGGCGGFCSPQKNKVVVNLPCGMGITQPGQLYQDGASMRRISGLTVADVGSISAVHQHLQAATIVRLFGVCRCCVARFLRSRWAIADPFGCVRSGGTAYPTETVYTSL